MCERRCKSNSKNFGGKSNSWNLDGEINDGSSADDQISLSTVYLGKLIVTRYSIHGNLTKEYQGFILDLTHRYTQCDTWIIKYSA